MENYLQASAMDKDTFVILINFIADNKYDKETLAVLALQV